MNALIVDDERPARAEMRRLLQAHPEVIVIGEAEHCEQAEAMVREVLPDLMFLDIQMPGGSGFDLLERLGGECPRVIFTTAHDTFAIRAFDVEAVDYLLKPVEPARLAAALLRVFRDDLNTGGFEKPLDENDRVFIREGERCWFVAVKEMTRLESEGNYTRVYFQKERALLCRSLGSFTDRLPARIFFRANRSQMINLEAIVSIQPWFGGTLQVRLADGTRVEISRRQSQSFRDRKML